MKKISIIIPVYNEEKNIPFLYKELQKILQELSAYDYEVILINDGSRDNSWAMLQQLSKKNEKIKTINFSRNFGHQMALTAGYDHATGDIIITMDADMQDPPSLILDMIKKYEEGYDIVYARRIDRNDGILKKLTASGYYHLLDHVSDIKIPRNVGDFRLINKKVLRSLKTFREKSRYLRGMVAWTGFNHTFIDFKRPNRLEGESGYTWAKMFKLAFDGLTGFSLFPLKIAAYIGVFVIVTGVMMFTYITLDALFNNVFYPLFKWLVTVIYIFMGVQFLLLWLIGEYIGRIHEQQKDRPLYIVDEQINF